MYSYLRDQTALVLISTNSFGQHVCTAGKEKIFEGRQLLTKNKVFLKTLHKDYSQQELRLYSLASNQRGFLSFLRPNWSILHAAVNLEDRLKSDVLQILKQNPSKNRIASDL